MFLVTWISNVIENIQHVFSFLMEITFRKQKCLNNVTKNLITSDRAPNIDSDFF